MGNASNITDLFQEHNPFSLEMGKVKYYVSSENPQYLDVAQMKPVMIAKALISDSI